MSDKIGNKEPSLLCAPFTVGLPPDEMLEGRSDSSGQCAVAVQMPIWKSFKNEMFGFCCPEVVYLRPWL